MPTWPKSYAPMIRAGARHRATKNDLRASPSARGYDRHWQKIRNAFIARHPLCTQCELMGRVTIATDVDHVVPKHAGGGDGWNNLQGLCKMHHSQKTRKGL